MIVGSCLAAETEIIKDLHFRMCIIKLLQASMNRITKGISSTNIIMEVVVGIISIVLGILMPIIIGTSQIGTAVVVIIMGEEGLVNLGIQILKR